MQLLQLWSWVLQHHSIISWNNKIKQILPYKLCCNTFSWGELPSITLTYVLQWYYQDFNVFIPFFSVQMIKHLRTAEFKPFVIFVKPPVIERLKETRQNAKFMSSKDDKGSARPFKVREHLSKSSLSIWFTPSISPHVQGRVICW